jgi:hypothetical protein
MTEAHDTSGATMAMKLKQILNKFEFTQKIMTYVKDDDSNLQTCVTIFNSIMSCTDLNMVKLFDGFYYGHALLKYVNMSLQVKRCFAHDIMHQ